MLIYLSNSEANAIFDITKLMLGIGIMSLAAIILSTGKGDLNAMLLVRRGALMYPFIQDRYMVSGKYNKIITMVIVLALALNNF